MTSINIIRICSCCSIKYYVATVWRETLEGRNIGGFNLVNDHKFAKVSSAKTLHSILNNTINIQICQSLFCQMCFCSEFAKICNRQSFPL